MVLEVPRSQFPPEMQLEIGMQLQLGSEEENKMVVAITAVTEEQITLDANHPLAGKDLTFNIQLQ